MLWLSVLCVILEGSSTKNVGITLVNLTRMPIWMTMNYVSIWTSRRCQKCDSDKLSVSHFLIVTICQVIVTICQVKYSNKQSVAKAKKKQSCALQGALVKTKKHVFTNTFAPIHLLVEDVSSIEPLIPRQIL